MAKEKIVLQSPEPLQGGGKNGVGFYFIFFGLGFVVGIILGLVGGTFHFWADLFFGFLALLIGWGIRNKQLKYKCFGLRTLRFLIEEKLPYPELYQRLSSCLGAMNIKVEMNQNGTISIPYNGLIYDIVYNEDDSFSVIWRQSFLKAVGRQGYYISVYKKVLAGMGLIAYHVQRVCLNPNEINYPQGNASVSGVVNEKTQTDSANNVNTNKKFPKWAIGLLIGGGVLVLGFLGVAMLLGGAFVSVLFENSTYYYSEMLEEYQCVTGGYTNTEIYDMLEICKDNYDTYGLSDFQDLTTDNTKNVIAEYINNNDAYIGSYVYMNGTITSVEGNIVVIEDELSIAESWQNEILGYVTGDVGALQYGVDLSLIEGADMENFWPGDYIEITGMYCGKIPLRDGTYTPAIVAVDAYHCSLYDSY